VAGNSRRDVLRFLAGVGVGAGMVEVYERLYSIPTLEERFRAEVSYWINEYNTARERINQLEQQYNSAKETITNLTNEYNLAREKINQLEEQQSSTLETISSIDRLEKESSQAILHYRERMDEAIKALKNTVEKYRVILGDERVSFESTTLTVLEDLKLSQDKLLKLLPYFPLIRDLSWRPSRVVNDKIYDIRVELEVISPLNTLAEVEVSLIPVEYEYFITNYGMSREDYPKAFPPEETKTIKLKPAGLERETYNVDFKDIIGGREYLIRAIAKDVATSVNSEERKTHYIRQYENISTLDDILVGAFYYPWWFTSGDHGNWWNYRIGKPATIHKPLLGWYDSDNIIVFDKHVDEMTGHGIDFVIVEWVCPYNFSHDARKIDSNLREIANKSVLLDSEDIKFCILYDTLYMAELGRLKKTSVNTYDLDDPQNRDTFIRDVKFIAQSYFWHPSYLKIANKPCFFVYDSYRLMSENWNIGGTQDLFSELRGLQDIYLMGDFRVTEVSPSDTSLYASSVKALIKLYDGITNGPFSLDEKLNTYENLKNSYQGWHDFAKSQKIDFIPTTQPGTDKTASLAPESPKIVIRRSIEKFQEITKIALNYLDADLKMLVISTFNEWYEDTQIEPSVEYKFDYLELIKESISKPHISI
jgi:hypothetical protein